MSQKLTRSLIPQFPRYLSTYVAAGMSDMFRLIGTARAGSVIIGGPNKRPDMVEYVQYVHSSTL